MIPTRHLSVTALLAALALPGTALADDPFDLLFRSILTDHLDRQIWPGDRRWRDDDRHRGKRYWHDHDDDDDWRDRRGYRFSRDDDDDDRDDDDDD